jgi:head-tail adaptor
MPATRGQRRHEITLRNPGPPIPDGVGGFSYEYVDLDPAQMDAAVLDNPPRNLERDPASTVLATATRIVTMDFHPQVTTDTRIWMEDGRAFNVTGVRDPDLRGVTLELTCEEVVP